MRGRIRLAVLIILAIAIVGAGLYTFALPGLSVARKAPSRLEVEISTWLLRHSVPASCRDDEPAEIRSGGDYRRHRSFSPEVRSRRSFA